MAAVTCEACICEVESAPHTPRNCDRKCCAWASQWVYWVQDSTASDVSTGSSTSFSAPSTPTPSETSRSLMSESTADATTMQREFEPSMLTVRALELAGMPVLPLLVIPTIPTDVNSEIQSPESKGKNRSDRLDRLLKGERCVSFLGQYLMDWRVTIILTFNPKGRIVKPQEIAAGLQSLDLCEQLGLVLSELGMYIKDKPYMDDYTKPLIKIPVDIQTTFLVDDFLYVETKVRALLKNKLRIKDRVQLKNIEVKNTDGHIVASLKVDS